MKHKAIRILIITSYLLVLGLALHVHGAKLATAGGAYSQCNGSIGECLDENEMLMESETARRILGGKRYISYGALNRNQPTCSGGPRGQAYSSNGGCLGHAANPYHRGCSKYYRCRSDA